MVSFSPYIVQSFTVCSNKKHVVGLLFLSSNSLQESNISKTAELLLDLFFGAAMKNNFAINQMAAYQRSFGCSP